MRHNNKPNGMGQYMEKPATKRSDTFELGDKGEAVVRHGLRKMFVDIRDVPKDIEAQLEWADFVRPPLPELGFYASKIEVKTEYEHTGNLFFETLSNIDTGRLGWAFTSPADELYYLFWDIAIGYRIPLFQHVKWHFDYCKNDFQERNQRKNEQSNLTRGRLVPVEWLKQLYVGVTCFSFQAAKDKVEAGELH